MKIKCLLVTFALGLGLTLGLVWLLGGRATPATAAPAATTRYVDDATGTDIANDCSDLLTPCLTIQHAVNQAGADDEIRVATGTYADTIARTPPPGYPNPPLSGLITQVVHISKTLTIRGGYTTTNWTTSHSLTQPTTLDAESGKRVIFVGGDNITVTLENLRITGGDATGLGGDPLLGAAGGGVYVITATVTLSGNVIYSNTVGLLPGSGGGVALAGSDGATLMGNAIYRNTARLGGGWGGGVALGQSDNATLSDNAIHDNTAYDGGGVALGQSHTATLSGNDIYRNTVTHDGGGIALGESHNATLSGNDIYSNTALTNDGGGVEVFESDGATLSANTIYGNRALNWGGGVELGASDGATLSGNTIYGNMAGNDGGGVELDDSDGATLSGNDIYSNTAFLAGGGVELDASDDATLSGNTIHNNAAYNGGGVQLAYSDDATLDNNVIADNQVVGAGSGVWVGASTANLRHNTIARNTGGNGSGVHVTDDSSTYSTVALTNTILVSHSVGINVTVGNTATLESTLWATGTSWANVTPWVNNGTLTHNNDFPGNPAFVDPDAGDYHIGAGSAAINRGIHAGVTTDIDGAPRDAAPDLGADEYRTCWARLNDDPTDYGHVQVAVDASTQPADVVKVAGYCAGVQARVGLSQSVYLSKTLTLRGGYTTTNWTTSDPDANPTTLDGLGRGRVLVISGTIAPTIEGLRFTGGDATGLGGDPWGGDNGGGVYVVSATATISNCRVYSNTASTSDHGRGGGLYFRDSAITLEGNTVFSNIGCTSAITRGDGGGMYIRYSVATLTGNTIFSNTAHTAGRGEGGGLYFHESDATLSDNTVRGNIASGADPGRGGGLFFYLSVPTLSGNTVQGNIASAGGRGYGGGLCLWNSDHATLSGNTVVSNTATLSATATGQGGGLFVRQSNSFTLTNNLVADNHANSLGSGLWFSSTVPISGRLFHTTIADNHSSGQGVYVGDYTTLAFTNTIVAGHGSVGITVTAGSTVTLTATLWHGNGADTGGAGTIISGTNVYGDPAFVDSAAWDYHLGAGSAAIDEGVDAGVATDKDGVIRPQGAAPDLGAYEVPPVELALTKTVDDDTPDPGQRITYTIIITNSGGLTATNGLISDTLPSGLTFAGPVTLDPAQAGATLADDAGDLPTLASGVTITHGTKITLTVPVNVNLDAAGQTITNTASVTSTKVITPAVGWVVVTVPSPAPVGGHTEPVSALMLLWPWILLAAAVITGAIGAIMLKRRRA